MNKLPDLAFIRLPEIFTFFFIMLGPLRAIAPFATLTAARSPAESRMIALRAVGLAVLTVLIASLIGSALLLKWHVAAGELAIAGGILFFLVALQIVVGPYSQSTHAPKVAAQVPSSVSELTRQCVPIVVTPWGIAAVIFFLTVKRDQTWPIIAILVGVMALDLLALLFARQILRVLGFPLQLLGTILSVLQVALSVELVVFGIKLVAIQRFGAHIPLGGS
ncbi:MAG: MarC family protein [Candidatus Eremiobacteraeota bacterium]|nr:MarC family protein [Candidatus Eremiobacteraeota bacterium]